MLLIVAEDANCDSDRELACPPKRRRQDNLLGVSDDESCQSLSRSSSLLQFESLEKQCQDISSSSPSIFSNISFDSLENHRKCDVSPDSLEQSHSDGEQEYYRTLQIDIPKKKQCRSKNSFSYNHITVLDGSDSSESADSEDTLEASRYDSCKSVDNFKPWRSFDTLNINSSGQKSLKEKVSAENLSEDSGYSDHLCNYMKNKSSSIPNISQSVTDKHSGTAIKRSEPKRNVVGEVPTYRMSKTFMAYDGDVFQNSSWSFGVSFQDLSVVEDLIVTTEYRSPLIQKFMRKGATKKRILANPDLISVRQADTVNIETAMECVRPSKYNNASASEPNLLQAASDFTTCTTDQHRDQTDQAYIKQCYFENSVCVSSVPNDLNLAGDLKSSRDSRKSTASESHSIAEKNCDIAHLDKEAKNEQHVVINTMSDRSRRTGKNYQKAHSISSESDVDMATFKREGSYMEAMSNMIDVSDDEYNPCYTDHTPRSTIVEFDRQILKAISETSIKSFGDSNTMLDMIFASTPLKSNKRNISTPNLAIMQKQTDIVEENGDHTPTRCTSIQDLPRKSSLINRSTSTSGVSDVEEKTLSPSKSFTGSTSSKGVHFSPVVSEVNWQDDSNSPDRESSYSLSSTPEGELIIHQPSPPTPPLVKPKPVIPANVETRQYASQPDLQNFVSPSYARGNPVKTGVERQGSFAPLQRNQAVSQPNLSRRRSSLIHKESDGSLVKAYTAKDGVMYRHTHLTLNSTSVYQPPTPASHVVGGNNAEIKHTKPVRSMESDASERGSKTARAGKLGGFLSRIASFRFPSRKNDEKKKKKVPTGRAAGNVSMPAQRMATKDDYIYIPLKGPEKSTNNNNKTPSKVDGRNTSDRSACVSAKPPLPKVPPRVVGASVKRRPETGVAHSLNPERRTIDSGDALPRPMEPMGLIETDLDTEVTVITSGAHVKTRSLMNLGAEAPPRSLAAPPHPSRPHKSMEFLLDKQNLKVVEVSLKFNYLPC